MLLEVGIAISLGRGMVTEREDEGSGVLVRFCFLSWEMLIRAYSIL